MHLINRPFEKGATVYVIRAQHDREAIDYALEGVRLKYEANVRAMGSGSAWFTDMEAIMRDGVVETVLQGAYLRAYHLWEKHCREYFPEMDRRNGIAPRNMDKINRRPYPKFIQEVVLADFGLSMPDAILSGLMTMNGKVRDMKHTPGLELKDFISADDYATALEAVEGFWTFLGTHEELTMPRALRLEAEG